MARSLIALMLLLGLAWGCSGEGGSVGDANDPATTSDADQMSDETGEVSDGSGDTE